MERRSATQTAPRRRYTIDPFEGIEELQEERPDLADTPITAPYDDSADEFEDTAAVELSDENFMSGVEDNLNAEISDDESARRPRTASSTIGDADEVNLSSPWTAFGARPRATTIPGIQTHNRGLSDIRVYEGSKEIRQLLYFGPASEDVEPTSKARKKWAYEPTLPSREADQNGLGGMHRSFYLDDKAPQGVEKWWLNQKGNNTFPGSQDLEVMDENAAMDYMTERQNGTRKFLIGPFKKQQCFELPVGQSISLQTPWNSADHVKKTVDFSIKREKSGFMIHLGSRIQCLDWAPSQNTRYQFLAAAILKKTEIHHHRSQHQRAPAFNPGPPHRSNVQIWRVPSTAKGQIDVESQPQLQIVLCTDWGDAKTLKWRPLPHSETFQPGEDCSELLAGVWSDGGVRVLKVDLNSSFANTTYWHVRHAAFESLPPNTVCTCLTWIGDSRLAAGCANGCVAIWDLTTAVTSSTASVRPVTYSAVSTSFIRSIASCYPSRPNMLLTSSMRGDIAVSDLTGAAQSLTSQATTIFMNRPGAKVPEICWHDFAQIALYVDDSFTLRGIPLRRFFSTVGLGRYKSYTSCVAVSPCHPFVLAGTAHGEVVSTNPVKRVIDGRSPIWQQTWFTHEWRRPREELGDETEMPITSDPSAGTGLSRILEGFKVERVSLYSDNRNVYNQQDGTFFATVYEEKSAITALAWNPNIAFGGWAAAGMADGLLRIEDIAS